MFEKEDVLPPCTCVMAALVLTAIYAWIGIYNLWRSQLRYMPLATIKQKVRILYWVFMTAVLSFCSVIILSFFSLYIWFFFFTD